MNVGLAYNLREECPPYVNAPPDYYAEFDSKENIRHLETAIESLGHRVCRIGNVHKLVQFIAEGKPVDIVFNMAEGLWGRSREAQVPALLEAYQIPYTGSDPLTLALCLDKALVKRLWQHEGLPTAAFFVVSNIAELAQAREALPGFPLFVKPVHEGASKGISVASRVETENQLAERVAWVLTTYRQPALVEEFLPGREFSVGILGSGPGARVLGGAEVREDSPYNISGFEEKEKYPVAEGTFVPVERGPLHDELSELALRAYLAMDCKDLGRVDFRLDKHGNPQMLELNPIVGLHPTNGLMPFIAAQAGFAFEALIGEILEQAINRWDLYRGDG